MEKSSKKRVVIIGIISAIVTIAIVIAAIFIAKGGSDGVMNAYKEIEVPANSTELTDVPEAPTSQKDTSDDDYINRDMQGRKIKEAEVAVPTVIETTVEEDSPKNKNNDKDNNKNEPKPSPRVERRTTAVNRPAPSAEDMNQVSNIGVRFKIPSIGLDTTYGMVDEVNGVLRPTNFTSVFGVRNRGVDYTKTDQGTAYVVTHTLDEGGIAPGNFIVQKSSNGASRVKKGDKIEIGDKEFTITDYKRAGKGVISTDKNIWDASIKNRMVLVICYPDSNDNFVVIAEG